MSRKWCAFSMRRVADIRDAAKGCEADMDGCVVAAVKKLSAADAYMSSRPRVKFSLERAERAAGLVLVGSMHQANDRRGNNCVREEWPRNEKKINNEARILRRHASLEKCHPKDNYVLYFNKY